MLSKHKIQLGNKRDIFKFFCILISIVIFLNIINFIRLSAGSIVVSIFRCQRSDPGSTPGPRIMGLKAPVILGFEMILNILKVQLLNNFINQTSSSQKC